MLVFTRSGDLAAKLGALRPNGAPLFAFTDVEGLHRRLRLIWGIELFLMDFLKILKLLSKMQSAVCRKAPGLRMGISWL